MEEIHFSAEVSEEMLRKYLELPNGIPSTDTILRVLAGSDGNKVSLYRYSTNTTSNNGKYGDIDNKAGQTHFKDF